MYTKKIFF